MAQDEDQGGELRQRVQSCGSDVQCATMALVDALVFGNFAKDVRKAQVSFYSDRKCQNILFITEGHEGRNIGNYCRNKTSQIAKQSIGSIMINAKCVGNASSNDSYAASDACLGLALETREDETPVELYWNANCDQAAGNLGYRGDMTVEEYCKAKEGIPGSGKIDSVRIGGTCSNIESITYAQACLQFAR